MRAEAPAHSPQSSDRSDPSLDDSVRTAAPEKRAKSAWRFLLLYYSIACAFAWIVWLPVILGPAGMKVTRIAVSLPVFVSAGTFGPCAAAFITHRVETGSWKAVNLLPHGWRWIWLLLGPFLVLFCFFFVFPAVITKGGPSAWHWHPMALAGIWAPMLNYNLFGGPLFEEFGWRGYLQPRLQNLLPSWIAAVCVGVLWALWHFPLFLVGWSSSSPLVFVFIMTGLSVVMAAAFNASGQAVLVPIMMHSSFNSSSRFLPAFLGDVPTREHPSVAAFIGISFLIVAAAAIACTRGRIFRNSGSGE